MQRRMDPILFPQTSLLENLLCQRFLWAGEIENVETVLDLAANWLLENSYVEKDLRCLDDVVVDTENNLALA